MGQCRSTQWLREIPFLRLPKLLIAMHIVQNVTPMNRLSLTDVYRRRVACEGDFHKPGRTRLASRLIMAKKIRNEKFKKECWFVTSGI